VNIEKSVMHKYAALVVAVIGGSYSGRVALARAVSAHLETAGHKCTCHSEGGDSPCVVHDIYHDLEVV